MRVFTATCRTFISSSGPSCKELSQSLRPQPGQNSTIVRAFARNRHILPTELPLARFDSSFREDSRDLKGKHFCILFWEVSPRAEVERHRIQQIFSPGVWVIHGRSHPMSPLPLHQFPLTFSLSSVQNKSGKTHNYL